MNQIGKWQSSFDVLADSSLWWSILVFLFSWHNTFFFFTKEKKLSFSLRVLSAPFIAHDCFNSGDFLYHLFGSFCCNDFILKICMNCHLKFLLMLFVFVDLNLRLFLSLSYPSGIDGVICLESDNESENDGYRGAWKEEKVCSQEAVVKEIEWSSRPLGSTFSLGNYCCLIY